MSDNKYISLRICGRPESNSGFSHIAMFNSPSFEVKDRVYSGFDANSYFFSIVVEKNQTVYKLIKNNVRSYGAIRTGNLVIAISIPKGFKIIGDCNPYDVLIELKDRFIGDCMTCRDKSIGSYEFNNGTIDPDLLNTLAKKYEIAHIGSNGGPYYPMAANGAVGYIMADEEHIKQLLADVRYPLFKGYSEVVVAAQVQDTNYSRITDIQIPRPKKYTVIKDGKPDATISRLEEIQRYQSNGDSNYYSNGVIEFSIKELENGEGFKVNGERVNDAQIVNFDPIEEEVRIDTNKVKKPRSKSIRLNFSDPKARDYFSSHKYELILNGQNGIKVDLSDDLSFIVSGEDIARWPNYSIRTIPTKYQIIGHNAAGDHINIETEDIAVMKPSPNPHVVSPVATMANINVLKLKISLPYTLCDNKFDIYKRIVKISDGSWEQKAAVQFDYDKKSNCYIKDVDVQRLHDSLSVKIDTPNYRLESGCIIKPGRNDEVTVNKFTRKNKSFFERKLKPRRVLLACVIGMLIGILIGFAVGYVRYNFNTRTASDSYNHEKSGDIDVSGGYSPHSATFDTQETFDDHVANARVFACDKCDSGFDSQEALDAHIASAHTFACDQCDSIFDFQEALDAHIASAHTFTCDQCHRTFATQESLAKHIADAHTPCTCNICKHQFQSRNELKTHENEKHHFACDECGPDTWFLTERELYDHKRNTNVKGTNRQHKR